MTEEENDIELNAQDEINPEWQKRYFMHIAYDGTDYSGWQRQLNGHTVQAEVESALCKILRQEKVITTGCGRTDAGVHARNFYLHFNTEKPIENIQDVFFKLSMLLPKSIGIYRLWEVHDKAHTRFDATERSYEYHMHQVRDPFVERFSTYYPWPLDVERMNDAASILTTYTDFESFCKTKGGQKTTFCKIKTAYWEMNGTKLVFYITADRFLRNMVRAIVGTMIDIGRGKLTKEDFAQIIEGKSRKLASESAKARGLHLTEVKYPYIP
jgi:tRNA pseudouridine38-40 synthase